MLLALQLIALLLIYRLPRDEIMIDSARRSSYLLSLLLQIQNENLSTGTPSRFRYCDKAYEIAHALSHLQGLHFICVLFVAC